VYTQLTTLAKVSEEERWRKGKECSEVPEHGNIPRHSVTVPQFPQLTRVSVEFPVRPEMPEDTRANFGTVTEWRGILLRLGTSEHSFPHPHKYIDAGKKVL